MRQFVMAALRYNRHPLAYSSDYLRFRWRRDYLPTRSRVNNGKATSRKGLQQLWTLSYHILSDFQFTGDNSSKRSHGDDRSVLFGSYKIHDKFFCLPFPVSVCTWIRPIVQCIYWTTWQNSASLQIKFNRPFSSCMRGKGSRSYLMPVLMTPC